MALKMSVTLEQRILKLPLKEHLLMSMHLAKKATVQLKMIGKFSVYNALAAMAACLVDGVSLDSIIKSLESIEGVSGRFEPVDAGQPLQSLLIMLILLIA
jgi:UDP-N-acetylmuramyl tripeptide synthase